MTVRKLLGAVLAVALQAATSHAVTINTYPDWDGSVSEGWYAIAQSFLAPDDNVLDNYMFALEPRASSSNLTFSVFEWDGTEGPIGQALFSTRPVWPSAGGDVLVEDIDLKLNPGKRYAAVIDLEGFTGKSVHYQENQASYSDGNASWFDNNQWDHLQSSFNTKFRAGFIPVPEPGARQLWTIGLGVVIWRRRRAVPVLLKNSVHHPPCLLGNGLHRFHSGPGSSIAALLR